MAFQPHVNQALQIGTVAYRFAPHPAAPSFPYGQEGRAATVYQVLTGPVPSALKVFKSRFRAPGLYALADQLAPLAALPGLAVCSRTVLTPQRYGDLLRAYPDLLYAVIMPWIAGPTWFEVITSRRALTREQSFTLARALAEVLATMEQRRVAHCDLSGANLLLPGLLPGVPPATPPVALVDVEQLYAPGFSQPEVLTVGSAGYAHRAAPRELWGASADRFAGAMLLGEILGACDPRICAAAWGDSFFDPVELQQPSERAHVLTSQLQAYWGEPVKRLWEQAWQSPAVSQCPTFGEWLLALPAAQPVEITPRERGTRRKDDRRAAPPPMRPADPAPLGPGPDTKPARPVPRRRRWGLFWSGIILLLLALPIAAALYSTAVLWILVPAGLILLVMGLRR